MTTKRVWDKGRMLRRLLLPVVLSILFHSAAFLGLSDLLGFDFLDPSPARPLFVSVVPQSDHTLLQGRSGKSSRSTPQESLRPAEIPQKDDEPRTDEQTIDVAPPPEVQDSVGEAEPSEELEMSDMLLVEKNEKEEEGKEGLPQTIEELPSDVADSTGLASFGKETLDFEIQWEGLPAGLMSLAYDRSESEWKIHSRIQSSGLISVFYKVDGRAESTIRDGLPVRFKETHEAGRRSSDKETIFNREDNKVVFINHRKGTTKEHTAQGILWDFVSGFYFLRTQSLSVGGTVSFDVFDSDKFFRVNALVLRKERLDLNGRQIDTLVIRPVVTPRHEQTEKLFQAATDILVWLSDNEARTPIRFEATTKIGRVAAELTTVSDREKQDPPDGGAGTEAL